MLQIGRGSIFDSLAQTLTNPVNCVGVMGKGLALEFKLRYPEMFAAYRSECARGEIRPGVLRVYPAGERLILNFPTKYHWRDPSKMEWIEAGLESLSRHYAEWGITSLAMPALGCGYGGLGWREVWPLIVRHLDGIDLPITVYPPPGI